MSVAELASVLVGIAALVLAGAGALKLADPEPTRRALRVAALPAPARAGTLLGILELSLAVAVLTLDGWAGLVSRLVLAGAFTGFAVLALRVRRRDPAAGCGCFGARSGPPDDLLVGTDLALATAALLAAATSAPAPAVLVTETAWGLAAAAAMLVGATGVASLLARPTPGTPG